MNKPEKGMIKRKKASQTKGEVGNQRRQEGMYKYREQHCFLELLWVLPLVLSLMRTSASVKQMEWEKTAKGKAVRKQAGYHICVYIYVVFAPSCILKWIYIKRQRLQVKADVGIRSRMDSWRLSDFRGKKVRKTRRMKVFLISYS